MKKLLVLLVLAFTTSTISAQTWKYSHNTDPFKGDIKVAKTVGVGSAFPYTTPTLGVRNNEGSIDIVLYQSGYYTHSIPARVAFKFDNDATVYALELRDYTVNGNAIFLYSFKNTNTWEDVSDIAFIDKMKSANVLYVEIGNDYSSNRLAFSLKGSSVNISKVLK